MDRFPLTPWAKDIGKQRSIIVVFCVFRLTVLALEGFLLACKGLVCSLSTYDSASQDCLSPPAALGT